MALYPVAGLTGTIELSVPLVQAILPTLAWRQRPGNKITPLYWTQHENGNPGADAEFERRYFHNGAEGRQASYHFVGDNTVVYQLLPVNENAWHAGDNLGPGNMKSIAGSIAQGAKNLTKARSVMEELCAGITDLLDIPTSNLRQHYDFAPNKKNCPQWIRRDGYWGTFVSNVIAIRAKTDPSQPTPIYETPFQIPALDITGTAPTMVTDNGVTFLFVGDQVEAIRDTPRYKWADKGSPKVGPDIRKGERFNVDWVFKAGDGNWWFYSPYDTRVLAEDCERVNDAKAA